MHRLVALGLSLALLTACFEGFGTLQTTVVLDPDAQVFRVERRVEDISAAFLGCGDEAGCAEVIGRLRALSPLPTGGPAERLMQRLIDSGAQDLDVEVSSTGDRIDAVVRYVAPLGTAAADDTLVRAEWEGKGDRGAYALAIESQPSMEPPRKYRTRRVARSGPAGPEWGVLWVLPPRQLAATTRMTVEPAAPDLLAEYPGLAGSLGLSAAQLASAPPPAPAPAPPPAPAPAPRPAPAPPPAPAPAPPPAPAPAPPPAPAPAPAPVAPAPVAPAWGPPDPASPAKTYLFDVTLSGGALSPAAATQATQPLHPRIARCYQDRHAEDPSVQGAVFLAATVRPDGFVLSTTVFGPLADRPLLACLESASADWTFPAFPGEIPAEVTLPVVFRPEAPPARRRR